MLAFNRQNRQIKLRTLLSVKYIKKIGSQHCIGVNKNNKYNDKYSIKYNI